MSKGMLGGIFGKTSDSEKIPTEVDDRLEAIEERLSLLEKRLQLVTNKMKELEVLLEGHVAKNSSVEEEYTEVEHQQTATHQASPIEMGNAKMSYGQYYLATPTIDGCFTEVSAREEVGKSLYLLTTTDGINGCFILLDTPDAIATAMISVSQFIKPVCKVVGNIQAYPNHIITEEEGNAVLENCVWKVVKKAVVKFES